MNDVILGVLEVSVTFLIFLLVLLGGWILSSWIGNIIKKLLRKEPIELDKKLEKMELDDALGYLSLSNIIGQVARWWLYVIFISQAVDIINLGVVTDMLNMVVLFIPKVIAMIGIIIVTFLASDFITDKMKKSKNVVHDMVASVLEWVINFVGVIIGVQQIGINLSFLITLVHEVVTIVLLCAGIGLAIAFGFSHAIDSQNSRMVLPVKVEKWWKKFNKDNIRKKVKKK